MSNPALKWKLAKTDDGNYGRCPWQVIAIQLKYGKHCRKTALFRLGGASLPRLELLFGEAIRQRLSCRIMLKSRQLVSKRIAEHSIEETCVPGSRLVSIEPALPGTLRGNHQADVDDWRKQDFTYF